MFEIKDGKIVLNKTRTLTPRQVHNLKSMSDSEKSQYIMSIMGLVKKKNLYVPRLKSYGHDVLLNKPKGQLLKHMKYLQNLERTHKPSENAIGKWIGVELEFFIPHQDSNHGGECECEYDADRDVAQTCDYCLNDGETHWSEREAHRWLKGELQRVGVTRCCIKEDGSLNSDNGHGVEVTILINTTYGFDPLYKLTRTLDKLGCFVNKTCGLHVHLDARHLTVKRVERAGRSLGNALPVLKYLVNEQRHTNDYCEMRVSKLIKISHDNNWDERYCAVNLTAYPKYKTIEVRLHHGTLDASIIENWVKVLQLVANAKLERPIETFQEFIDLDGVNESMVNYLESQITTLNDYAWHRLNGGTIEAILSEAVAALAEQGA